MNPQNIQFDDEINLREWIDVLLRFKWQIGVAALLTAAAAMLVGLLLPKTYEAASLVTITSTRFELQFDTRIETINEPPTNLQSFGALALSGDILQQLFDQAENLPEEIETPNKLADLLEAEVRSDLIYLRVQMEDPAQAAQLANLWADLFIKRANELYNRQDLVQLPFFEDQLRQAQVELDTADQALIAFEQSSRAAILQKELDSALASQVELLEDQRTISATLRSLDSLIAQLNLQPTSESAGFSAQLASLVLQLSTINRGKTEPVQIQVTSPENFSLLTVADQIRLLENLSRSLEQQQGNLEAQIQALEPRILSLQGDLQSSVAQKDKLVNQRNIAEETAISLALKVEEAKIASQDSGQSARLGSYALTPVEPVSPRLLILTAVGGAAGLFLAVLVVFALAWWRASKPEQAV